MPRSPAIFLIYSLRCRGSWEYSRHLTSWWSSGDVFWGRSCLLMPLSLWWTLWISSQTFLYWILSLGTLHLLSGSDFRLYSLTFKVSTLCAVIFILSILCDQIVPYCPWISIKSYWLQLGMPLKGLIEYSLGFGNTKKLLFLQSYWFCKETCKTVVLWHWQNYSLRCIPWENSQVYLLQRWVVIFHVQWWYEVKMNLDFAWRFSVSAQKIPFLSVAGALGVPGWNQCLHCPSAQMVS